SQTLISLKVALEVEKAVVAKSLPTFPVKLNRQGQQLEEVICNLPFLLKQNIIPHTSCAIWQ
ncbi:MAG: hypothetical protein K1000chlam2_00614, partial [Chlamydiae bacterium]|nr:hypothetical protein [Chlamydiota bacterium]